MLYLNKLLPIFVLPLGWVVLLLLFALIRRRRWPAIVALTLLYVCSTSVVGNLLLHGLETRYPPIALDQVDKADAIVALGGMFGPASPDGYLANMSEASERLEAGIELWQRKKADWLVFTAGRIPWEDQAEAEGMRAMRAAIARGIPQEKILVTREVGNTADESLAVRDLMRERGWQKIILVTSAWHMPRKARLFRKAGVNFIPFTVDIRIDTGMRLTALDFLPRADGLRDTETALREWYGIAFYALVKR
jgi:uncharacterized SAM-binding protein YcdF (DUF218 family)